jgi:hypothetical protein
MRPDPRLVVAILACVLAAPLLPHRASPREADRGGDGRGRQLTDALARSLRSSGRARASFERESKDPLSGSLVKLRGELALELPDRVALSFAKSGERLSLHGDGGEWLQPGLRQMLVLAPSQVAAARRWWDVLMQRRSSGGTVRRLPSGAFLLFSAAQDSPDSAWVWIDRRGLPARLEIADEATGRQIFNFKGWRFSAALGRGAFVLHAPPGYRVVEMP